ncbi:MAG: S6 modification enzyme RimK [Eubacteriales bacterium]
MNFPNAQSADSFSALKIQRNSGIAVEFYDLILENDHLAALLGCRGNDDIAIQIDEVTGTMTGWHWFK